MKTASIALGFLLLLPVAPSAFAAPTYVQRSAKLAAQFLGGAETGEEDLKKFISTEEIVGEDFLKMFQTAVAVGRDIAKQGTPASNKNFAGLVAESLGAGSSEISAPGPSGDSHEPAPDKPQTAAEAKAKLIKIGLSAFARHGSQTQQIYLVRAFGVTLEDNIDWAKFKGGPDGSGADPRYTSFLVRLGASEKKRAVEAAKKAKPDDKAKAIAPALSSEEQAVAAKAGGDKTEEKSTNIDAKLRSAGFSFSQGFGVVTGSKAASVGTLVVRWNAYQRRTTVKWNELVNYGSRKGGEYQQVEYFGSRGSSLVEDELGPAASIKKVNNLMDFSVFCPTAIGPFFGGGLVGERIKFGRDSAGGDKLERPYLVGLSLGWGFYDEAGSAFYFDVGYSASPTSGFKHSRPFVGISFDAIVLGKITGFVRKSATTSASQ